MCLSARAGGPGREGRAGCDNTAGTAAYYLYYPAAGEFCFQEPRARTFLAPHVVSGLFCRCGCVPDGLRGEAGPTACRYAVRVSSASLR
eukprot:scaffold12300_cov132-Isochrysis_galbana.AAC.9